MQNAGDNGATARRRARELVEQIQEEHGHVGEETLRQIADPTLRARLSHALNIKDGMIGSSVITLAKNLYTSNARFVFELLQNADDNEYTKTSDSPFISFHVFPQKIVVEYNEDGFTPGNLRAICNVGQSTKKGAQGYIGEKGIGFKSVFMVAWKVLIQSGDFSFCFEHRKGDSGMGMISPVWQEPEAALSDSLTQLTLFLHDSGDAASLATQRQLVSSQFHELQDTFLLFLKNIKKIDLKFYDDDNKMTKEVTHCLEHSPPSSRPNLTKKAVAAGKTEQTSRIYHVTRQLATGLERNENREYSEEEEAQRKYVQSEVVLAFPLADDLTPPVEALDVFAFLPLRSAECSFLIQADFVTEANRQDVIAASPRNLGLLDGIAHAFVKAVLAFCKHPTLTYQWMRCLPDPSNASFQPFWKRIIDKIQERLNSAEVLHSRTEGPLRLIKSLRIPTFDSTDKDGNPLWDDIDPPGYLSPAYSSADLPFLRSYGLIAIWMHEILDRADADLKSPSSRTKTSRDKDWHSRAARILVRPFTQGRDISKRLSSMCLIPLQNGQWISADRCPIYYASSAGVQIPTDLGLNLIEPTAAEDADRKALFDHLGVTDASIDRIRTLLFAYYTGLASLSPQASRDHLVFLYLTQAHAGSLDSLAFSKVYVFTQQGSSQRLIWPAREDVYIRDTNEYGTEKLLKRTSPGLNPGDDAPGLAVLFLHEKYFEDAPDKPAGHTLTWRDFLKHHLNVQIRPRLVFSPSQQSALSNITRYLQRHRPEVFLRVMHYYWKTEGQKNLTKPSNIAEVCAMEALCRGHRMIPLCETYLPTPSLERLQARYMVDSEPFPFLELLFQPTDDADSDGWNFLHTEFRVGRHDGLDFYLTMLRSILNANGSAESVVNSPRIYGVYGRIQAKLLSEIKIKQTVEVMRDTFLGMITSVRNLFETRAAILIPASRGRQATWVRPSQCLWDGPEDMQTKFPVKSLCQTYFAAAEPEAGSLEQFFRITLGLSDCSWRDLVDEVRHLKETSCTDFDRINALYKLIHASVGRTEDANDIEQLRQAVDEQCLIYVNVNGRHNWCNISRCLWASATTIRGRITLNDHYEDLEDFFVKVLGVSELSFDMVLDDLIEKGASQASVEEIKETLWILTSLLSFSAPTSSSSERLLKSRVFPVKYPNGQVLLRASNVDFGIVDRQRLGVAFAGKANLLDFRLEEARLLKPLFTWLGLERRYLSNMIKEISRLDGDKPVPISSRDRDIGRKAPALFRIATHYNSPRVSDNDSSLKDLLHCAVVYETDGISSLLVLSQDGHEVTVEVEKTELHVREDASGLQVYVPRDSRSQDCCYLSKLPPRLLGWMMTHPDTQIREKIEPDAVLVVTKILNAKSSLANWILEEAGIVEVAGAEGIDVPGNIVEQDVSDFDQDEEAEEQAPGIDASLPVTPVGSSHAGETILTPTTSEPRSHGMAQMSPGDCPIPATSRSPQPQVVSKVAYSHSQLMVAVGTSSSYIHRVEGERPASMDAGVPLRPDQSSNRIKLASGEDADYLALLDNVINQARNTPLPNTGPFDMSQLIQALSELEQPTPDDEDRLGTYRFRSARRRQRDFKIGAAGELFVFELLSHLDPQLPGFGQANWQSTTRKYVKVHQRYASMEDWQGRDTADLVYDDSGGVLTSLLIDAGYLAATPWANRRPKYYIEVKSTTRQCGTPFFMRKHQYKRMQDLTATASGDPSSSAIYAVFRVFNLGMGRPGVRIYLDPEAMRQKGDLEFTAETWSVVPRQAEGRA